MSAISNALDELEHHHGQATSAAEARAELTALLETIRWIRQTVHQAHHQGEIETCSINTCDAARQALANDAPCSRCHGCGQIADSKDGEPWSVWLELPFRSSLAVLTGLVKPIPCPKCRSEVAS